MDYSLLAASVHGISQARIPEWIAISFSRGPFPPRDQTHVSCIGRRVLYHWAIMVKQINHRYFDDFQLLSFFYSVWELDRVLHFRFKSKYMNTQWLFIIPSPVAVKHIYTHIHTYKTNIKQTQVEMLGYLAGVGAGSWYRLITNQHIPLREEISVSLLQGVREHIAEFKKTKSTIHNTEFVFG